MTSYTPDNILAVAREAAAKAAKIIVGHRRDKTFHIHEKGERNFVTTADLEADRVIVETI
jgi:3'-phosphoadenosine 5'-phosphosulfate (PAPS) 3'-phosphatase